MNYYSRPWRKYKLMNKWKWIEKKEFPKLARLNEREMKDIIKQLATHKAITLDGLSDIMFEDPKHDETQTI